MTEINTIEEWLGTENQLGIDILKNKYTYNNETFPQWIKRVSGGNKDIAKLILEKKFLFGGRTLTNRGTNIKGSYSNCYSSGFVKDSLDDIMETNSELALTYKAQGGQGLSLTKLRPKGTPVGNGEYTSDGIIPFMKLFNQTTESISQGGSRKGALLMSLDAWHKQIEDFITIKSDLNEINKANLSVEIDDDFMKVVVDDLENNTETIIHRKETYGKHEIKYDITPIKIFKKLAELSWDNGEPALIFVGTFRNYNIMEFADDYEIEICNPCGEQPLPKYGACNLGSINLSEFVMHPYTDWAVFNYDEFESAVKIAITGLDEVLDEGIKLHALKEQQEMAKNYRNVGLGIMGLGSMFFKLGITYGDEISKKLLEDIMKLMFKTAVMQSNKLAKEKGTFPKYSDKVWKSTIIENSFNDTEIKELKKNGLRNCSLLSIAPSGSIGTLLNVTTGCEPAFAIKYQRKTESLHKDTDVYYDIYIQEAKEYMKLNNIKELPDYFITSTELNWKDRVEIQAILQKYVDTSISSTVNLPNSSTVEDIMDLYVYAWKLGCKGITVFREGCKRVGILTTENKEENQQSISPILEWGGIINVNDDVIGKKRKLNTGCGSLHFTAFFDPVDGKLLETYLSKGSSGGCDRYMVGLSRMTSLCARAGVPIETIIDQLNSSGTCPSYAVKTATQHNTSKGNSCPTAIGCALVDMYKDIQDELGLNDEDEKPKDKISKTNTISSKSTLMECPQCGEKSVIFEIGCQTCKSCGWTKCE